MSNESPNPCSPGSCQCKPPLSQRAYARHRGVSHVAVGKAIASQRLVRCLDADGKVTDVALADAEWTGNTSYAEAPIAVRQKAAAFEAARKRAVAPQGADGPEPPPLPDAIPPESELTSNEVARRKTFWQAKSAELDFKQEAGELVPARDVRIQVEDAFRTCRTKLLNIPSRVRQRLPHLTLADMAEIEAQIRTALEDLASEADR